MAAHALAKSVPHRFHGFLVRGAILSPAAVRLSRDGGRHPIARTVQGDGAQAVSRDHAPNDGAYARHGGVDVDGIRPHGALAALEGGPGHAAGRLPLLARLSRSGL